MSNYKKYFLKQLGIRESLKQAGISPDEVPQDDLLAGMEHEKEHSNDPKDQKTIALQHMKEDPAYYDKLKNAGLEELGSGGGPSQMLSPTVKSPSIIAMAIRGSSTGGLPTGSDREMSLSNTDGVDVSNMTAGQLGGYEPIPIAKDNSTVVNKTPVNSKIKSSQVISGNTVKSDNHPHQFQNSTGEPPQNVTGASVEDSEAADKVDQDGIDIDLTENKNRGMDKTFVKHLRLMNESIKNRNLAECDCSPDCDCDGEDTSKNEPTPEPIKETYSAPFAKMRGLANLGERRVSKTGLWETTSNKPTKWKMNKEKAGMVKINEKKLLAIKENLSKKQSLTETESIIIKKIEEVLKHRNTR